MDAEGFAAWYAECHARTVAGLWALGADRALAEDCAAEAFARALAQWPRVREMEHPRRWLQTVALNVLRRAMRRRRLEGMLWARGRAASTVGEPEPAGDVWRAVRALPAHQRVAVTLRYAANDNHEKPDAGQILAWVVFGSPTVTRAGPCGIYTVEAFNAHTGSLVLDTAFYPRNG